MQPQSVLKPAGIILAGGQSSRMGRDKALLEINGETLLQRNQRLLSEVGCEPVIVSGQHLGGVADIYPQRGPLSGLHAGLARLLDQSHPSLAPIRVLVVPVDMPKLTVETLRELLTVDTSQPVYYQQCALPCALNLSVELLRYIENCLRVDNADRSLKRLLTVFDAKPIIPRHRQQLVNTNTPTQWHELVKEINA